jgi:heme-degrading monooxygenase HmoA
MDDATSHLKEQTLPQLRQMDGFEGFVSLGDRNSGKLLGVAFWESEEALRATEQAVSSVRSGAAEATGGTVLSVEEYEVLVNEAPSAGPLGAVTGTVGGVTDTVGGATQPVSGATDTVGGVTDTLGGTTGNLLGDGEKKASEGRATSTDSRRIRAGVLRPGPYSCPLFTGVRRRGVLRTSRVGGSEKFAEN